MTTGKSIKYYLLASWIVPMLLAVAGSAVFSIGISYLNYSNHKDTQRSELQITAQTIARRIAAELLLKENGRPKAVLDTLKADYKLDSLEIASSPVAESDTGSITVSEPIPDIQNKKFIRLKISGPLFAKFINFKNFLFALIPILALVLSGFFIQNYLVRKYIIRPIKSLAETSTGNRPVKDYWPTEIQKIASELAETFSEREQAIFGKLARGLVHDIRTQINSISIALQLVNEAQPGTSDKASRLNRLESACARNIPKVKELLELSLDSSREIVLKPKPQDISNTVSQSIQNVQELADAKGVEIVSNAVESIQLNHDRLQLERVFTNLIKNAIEATENQSTFPKRVEIFSKTTPTGIEVRVEDSGSGFADLKQIFRPLKTTKTHGYGLGLFVSKKIVEAHLGILTAQNSEKLGGASFTVSLPVNGTDRGGEI